MEMENEIKTIVTDHRTIEGLYYDDERGSCFVAGHPMCEKIIAYEEKGQGDLVPYFAVFHNGQVSQRVPAYKVTVVYKAEA